MNATHMPSVDHHGALSKKRMHLRPMLPIPVNYETAAIPTFAPFGTDYTPDHTMRIIGGRAISIPDSVGSLPKYPLRSSTDNPDPDLAPTRAIQNVHAQDNSHWQNQTRPRFDTTYRTEFINRIRHPEYVPWYQQSLPDYTKRQQRVTRSELNQYSVLPPIIPQPTNTSIINNYRNIRSPRRTSLDTQRPSKDQEIPSSNGTMSKNVPPLNLNNGPSNFSNQQQQQPPMMNDDDTYLPEEPILLTDYEEQRLTEQIRNQLGNSPTVDRLKLLYQELTAYDPNGTNYIHYSNIQLVASQLGLDLQEDTLRFAMCKFVSPDRPRGFVNYEDMIRYFGKCLSSITPNQYGQQRNGYDNDTISVSRQRQTPMRHSNNGINDNDKEHFDPDERQIRILLRQNLKYFDVYTTVDFDKLTRELRAVDRTQTGVLNRQQIEEVVYKVRIPIQRSIIYQILERHCRSYPGLYKWEAFVQYLKEQILDIKNGQDGSSSIQRQPVSTANQWLDQLRREFNENSRLQIIERYIGTSEGPQANNNKATWFTRFLRLANTMYTHRTSTNREQDFVLPREEARRLLRAYNQVWDLQIDENRLQRVLDACARNGNVAIDDALKLLAR